jgi:hypothetical protein
MVHRIVQRVVHRRASMDDSMLLAKELSKSSEVSSSDDSLTKEKALCPSSCFQVEFQSQNFEVKSVKTVRRGIRKAKSLDPIDLRSLFSSTRSLITSSKGGRRPRAQALDRTETC